MLRMCEGLNGMMAWNINHDNFISAFDKQGKTVLLNPTSITRMVPLTYGIEIEDINVPF